MNTSRVATKKLAAQVAEALALRLLDGTYAPGRILPNELELTRMTGVSRTTLRAAVQALVAKGLIEVGPSRGTRVLPRENWNLLDAQMIAWQIQLGVTVDLVRSIYELRECFEPRASQLAAERCDEAGRNRIAAAFEALRASRQKDENVAALADVEFHTAILASCGNDFIISFGSMMRAVLQTSFSIARHRRRLSPEDIERHRLITEAILSGDGPAAERATAQLLAASKMVQMEAAADIDRSTRVSRQMNRTDLFVERRSHFK